MEPTGGFEPPTCCLRNSCSATELRRHLNGRKQRVAPAGIWVHRDFSAPDDDCIGSPFLKSRANLTAASTFGVVRQVRARIHSGCVRRGRRAIG
jgi:hypothetical protein